MHGYDGLIPKILTPKGLLKKITGKKKTPAVVEAPVPVEVSGNPQGQMILLGAAALGLVLLLSGGRNANR